MRDDLVFLENLAASGCGVLQEEARELWLSGKIIRDVVLGHPRIALPDHQLVLTGVRITSDIDLAGCAGLGGTALPALRLLNCTIDANLLLSGAVLRGLSFRGSRLRRLDGRGLHLASSLDFTDARVSCFPSDGMQSAIDLTGAHIDGEILGDRAQLDVNATSRGEQDIPPRHRAFALKLAEARVDGSIFLQDGFSARGGVDLVSAKVANDLRMAGATLVAVEGPALRAHNAEIGGLITLEMYKNDPERPFRAIGVVSIEGAAIGHGLRCSGGRFRRGVMQGRDMTHALNCEGARINGEVLLDRGFNACGLVRLSHVRVTGNVECSGGKFYNFARNSKANALTLANANIGGTLRLRGRADDGRVTLPPADVYGSINLRGASVTEFADEKALWLRAKANGHYISLDGLTYQRLFTDCLEAEARLELRWLHNFGR